MAADIEWVRRFCLSLPHVTQSVQWGDSLVFKVAGKMFAVASLEPRKNWLSFKCSPESFAELTERPGIDPAPYLARAQWAALTTEADVQRQELRGLLQSAYDLVFAKLPRKTRAALV